MKNKISSILTTLLNTVYPPKCIFCRCTLEKSRPDKLPVCFDCKETLPFTDNDGCFQSDDPESIAYIIAPFEYRYPVDAAIRRLKFSYLSTYAPTFASFICDYLVRVPEVLCADMVIPVPLGKRRKRERDFNQSGLIGAAVAKTLGLPFDEDILLRVRETARQSSLSKLDRLYNVMDAFAAAQSVEGMTILLVDDVYTTGSTVISCARALKNAGAEKIILAAAATASRNYYRGTPAKSAAFPWVSSGSKR